MNYIFPPLGTKDSVRVVIIFKEKKKKKLSNFKLSFWDSPGG